jgi:two-component system response regulator RegA
MSTHDDTHARSLLLVDDDAVFRARLARALRERGLFVREAGNVEEALALAHVESPEWAVVDLRMPGASGLVALEGLRAIDPTTRVVVLTGYGSIANAVAAMKLGAVHYLSKPVDADQLLACFQDDRSAVTSSPEQTPSLARVEWEHIHQVLATVDGNISQAARLLGLHRRSLQRKLEKFPAPR